MAAFALAMLPAAAMPTDWKKVIAANEMAAISALREIAAAQAAFKAAVEIDTNCDGIGEYGYFAELAGTVPMRVPRGEPCVPCAGGKLDYLSPPLLRSAIGMVMGSVTTHHGYLFQMWLPAATVGGQVRAMPEDWTGGATAPWFPDPINGAKMWCCYAWPITVGQTGQRAFCISERGAVIGTGNQGAGQYGGRWGGPDWDAAYSTEADMSSGICSGVGCSTSRSWWPVR